MMSPPPCDARSGNESSDLFWPLERLHEAVREALLRVGLVRDDAVVSPVGATSQRGSDELVRWLRHATRPIGVEGASQRIPVSALEDHLDQHGAYLILARPNNEQAIQGISVVRTTRGRCLVIRPGGHDWHIGRASFCKAVRKAATRAPDLSSVFEGLPGGDRALRRLIEREGVVSTQLTVVRYELDAAHPLTTQLKRKGAVGRVSAFVAVTALQGIAAGLAAFTLGNAGITGVLDLGRVFAWSMLAASVVPFQYVSSLILGGLTLDVGALLKKRLLDGALVVGDSEVRGQGLGALLGRLNEASIVEQSSVLVLFRVLTPLGQLVGALLLLISGALPILFVALLVSFVIGAIAISASVFRRYRRCHAARLSLTEDLIEKVLGHRTRAAQANLHRLHDEEDVALNAYARKWSALSVTTALSTVYGRLWLLAALCALLWPPVFQTRPSMLFASAIGIFLAYTSLPALLQFIGSLAAWVCAWEGVRPLFVAGRSQARTPRGTAEMHGRRPDTVVSALSFAYPGRRSILSDAKLRIKDGDRLLIRGPSGAGKSTLSKLLTGELYPTSGTILVDGVDCFSVSEAEWRRRVASSPQFHENCIFSNTFGFNVDPKGIDGRMSRDAFLVCQELGLGDLLAKMPSGAAQILGETGWQLSHGERSRVFIARSLLQGADLLIFDESFGALDPESLALALGCVRRRARTLVVIGHQ
jgi:ATP-binding cassette, subfamily B, bacterial